MCGVAGFVGPEQPERARQAVAAMARTLCRRGPDSEGIECWPGAVLGHRRLSILDLSPAGRQPMLSEDREIGVTFNGCIYNFLELRKELEGCGHGFRSQCDTEVLLRGYQQWGVDELARRARGMFAFGVWDNRSRTLALVRDRLGVKPLVYAAQGGRVAFSSTVAALRAAGLAAEIDPQAVLEFLEFGHVTEARTIYREVKKVPPATILEWKDGVVRERRYWKLPEPSGTPRITFPEAVEETERLALEAVRLRLQADVPVGALLSAGIDSSLVCWALAKLNSNVSTFTVSTPGDEADEAPAATATARRLGVPHQSVVIAGDGADALEELTSAYGEPFGCSSALAMLRVSRAVQPLATVLLTGDGGDDVFLGYRVHPHLLTAQRLAGALPSFAGPLWRGLRPIADGLPGLRRAKHLLDYSTGGLGAVTRAHDGLPFYQRRGMLGPKLSGLELAQRQIERSARSAKRVFLDVLQYDLQTQFAGEFMTKVDGATMHYSLEARSPFLDHKVWEFAAQLPLSLRLQGGVRKAILREIVRRRIGEEVAFRKKQGFTIPVERWLAARWSPALQELASQSMLEREGWLLPGALRAPVREAVANGLAPVQLWYLLVLEKWLQRQAGAEYAPRNSAAEQSHLPAG